MKKFLILFIFLSCMPPRQMEKPISIYLHRMQYFLELISANAGIKLLLKNMAWLDLQMGMDGRIK